jgi:hypothetical protein
MNLSSDALHCFAPNAAARRISPADLVNCNALYGNKISTRGAFNRKHN